MDNHHFFDMKIQYEWAILDSYIKSSEGNLLTLILIILRIQNAVVISRSQTKQQNMQLNPPTEYSHLFTNIGPKKSITQFCRYGTIWSQLY